MFGCAAGLHVGYLCARDGAHSRIWLLVNEDARLDQMIKQTGKLHDVRAVRRHPATHEVFVQLEAFFRE